MLYEMAKLHDEWQGNDYSGSSIRGAVKGFYHNGVCSEDDAPYLPGGKDWTLTIDRAKAARRIRLGAYYRLERDVTAFHAALNEVGVVYASAQIHKGWLAAKGVRQIVSDPTSVGGHAFSIVGYDKDGFIVQNSWGDGLGPERPSSLGLRRLGGDNPRCLGASALHSRSKRVRAAAHNA